MQSSFQGHYGQLEKLNPEFHRAQLWACLKDQPSVWAYMGYGDFASQNEFNAFLEKIAVSQDPFYYAILQNNQAVGWMALMEHRPAHKSIEVGNIVFSPLLQRTPLATETIYMLGKYVFEVLGYRRFEWKCNNQNLASKKAATRFGFTFEGLFRQHMIIKGKNRDTAWFSMLDSEWPALKINFERWLSLDNFDLNAQQLSKLRE